MSPCRISLLSIPLAATYLFVLLLPISIAAQETTVTKIASGGSLEARESDDPMLTQAADSKKGPISKDELERISSVISLAASRSIESIEIDWSTFDVFGYLVRGYQLQHGNGGASTTLSGTEPSSVTSDPGFTPPSQPPSLALNPAPGACSVRGVANYSTHSAIKYVMPCGAKATYIEEVLNSGQIVGNMYLEESAGSYVWRPFAATMIMDGSVTQFVKLKKGPYKNVIALGRTSNQFVGAGCLAGACDGCLNERGEILGPGPTCQFDALFWSSPTATPQVLPSENVSAVGYSVAEAEGIANNGKIGGSWAYVSQNGAFGDSKAYFWSMSGGSYQPTAISSSEISPLLPDCIPSLNACSNVKGTAISKDGNKYLVKYDLAPFCPPPSGECASDDYLCQYCAAIPHPYTCPAASPGGCKITSSFVLDLMTMTSTADAQAYIPSPLTFPQPSSLYEFAPVNSFSDQVFTSLSPNGDRAVGTGRSSSDQLNNPSINLIPAFQFRYAWIDEVPGQPPHTYSNPFKMVPRTWSLANGIVDLPLLNPTNSIVDYHLRSASSLGAYAVGQGYNGGITGFYDSKFYRSAIISPSLSGASGTFALDQNLSSVKALNPNQNNPTGLVYQFEDALTISSNRNLIGGYAICHGINSRADNFVYGYVVRLDAARIKNYLVNPKLISAVDLVDEAMEPPSSEPLNFGPSGGIDIEACIQEDS